MGRQATNPNPSGPAADSFDESYDRDLDSSRGWGGLTGAYTPGGYEHHRWQERDPREDLEELLHRLQHYDRLRVELEQKGGRVSHLAQLSRLLGEPLSLGHDGRQRKVALVDQDGLRSALKEFHWGLHLEVRLKYTRMPVYYLCRSESDYWSEYSLIVADYHLSPGYPMADTRFVRLMHGGHEEYHLRLSPFREAMTAHSGQEGGGEHRKVDNRLYALGRHVFQAAWHQDQQLAVLVARHLALPVFAGTVEMLYLCLSAELCELRHSVDDGMRRFFKEVYPQPAIAAFLDLLPSLEGSALNELPRRGLQWYAELAGAFSRFLATEVTWGRDGFSLPLWKILYGNLNRMDLVAHALKTLTVVSDAGARLERAATKVVQELLN